MVDAGCSHVFMEVSSHAVDQLRIAEIQYAGGVFTNITHDHLDYHKTFAAYIKAKQSFFSLLPNSAFALTNEDDKNGRVMLEHTKGHKYGYSLRRLTDFKGKVLSSEEVGTYVEFDGHKFMTRLVGKFNVYNLLAVYSVARLLVDLDTDKLLITLSSLREVKGRMEVVAESPRVIVDYAHTPDALSNVLKTIRGMSKRAEIITVVGCGGDRDTSKRPIMCKVAMSESDRVILTSDNPRSEDPQRIIKDMLAGLEEGEGRKILQIVDRRSAIQTAIALANKETIILIAGKGHEEYQEIKGERFFFSDQEIVKDILSKDI
ncbi:MAG: UDP-N-acetylmuramoyl-L-alanyl-D-glutamate--2,6-diaminopimelate ligase [Saprospiraceae bacterium]|jgi:UDP-N-acetylmuramoyl-L-alanyl-D-glutamate--2,6-diaminopimelate ligase